MGLVEVAAVEGDLAEAEAVVTLQEANGTPEAQDARQRLRRQPDLLAEAGDEPLPAPAELRRQRLDANAARRSEQPLPGPAHAGRSLGRVRDTRTDGVVDDLEALRPGRCVVEPLNQPIRFTTEDVVQLHDAARECVHRHPEEQVCPERRQVDFDAGGLAVVLRNGGALVQTCDE